MVFGRGPLLWIFQFCPAPLREEWHGFRPFWLVFVFVLYFCHFWQWLGTSCHKKTHLKKTHVHFLKPQDVLEFAPDFPSCRGNSFRGVPARYRNVATRYGSSEFSACVPQGDLNSAAEQFFRTWVCFFLPIFHVLFSFLVFLVFFEGVFLVYKWTKKQKKYKLKEKT